MPRPTLSGRAQTTRSGCIPSVYLKICTLKFVSSKQWFLPFSPAFFLLNPTELRRNFLYSQMQSLFWSYSLKMLSWKCLKPISLTNCDCFSNAKNYWATVNINSNDVVPPVICWFSPHTSSRSHSMTTVKHIWSRIVFLRPSTEFDPEVYWWNCSHSSCLQLSYRGHQVFQINKFSSESVRLLSQPFSVNADAHQGSVLTLTLYFIY